MEGTEEFKKVIIAYLEGEATKDALFAQTYAKPNKNIDECVTYILSEVQKSGKAGFADSEIFKMAKHYYDEDDIKPGSRPSSGRIVTNQSVPEKPKAEPKPVKKTKPKPSADTGVVQTSLF